MRHEVCRLVTPRSPAPSPTLLISPHWVKAGDDYLHCPQRTRPCPCTVDEQVQRFAKPSLNLVLGTWDHCVQLAAGQATLDNNCADSAYATEELRWLGEQSLRPLNSIYQLHVRAHLVASTRNHCNVVSGRLPEMTTHVGSGPVGEGRSLSPPRSSHRSLRSKGCMGVTCRLRVPLQQVCAQSRKSRYSCAWPRSRSPGQRLPRR